MWEPFNFFIGERQGSSQRQPGISRVQRKYEFVRKSRGTVNVKGKGDMEVWLVNSVREKS